MSTHDFVRRRFLGRAGVRRFWEAHREPEITLSGRFKVGFGHVGERRIALDQHRASARGDRRDAGRATTGEWIENEASGRDERPKELRHQQDRFGRWVRLGIADPRHEEESITAQVDGVGGHDVGGVPARLRVEGRTLTRVGIH